MEDAAIRHSITIFYWHINKFRGKSQSELVPVKDRKTISDKKIDEEIWLKHFEIALTVIDLKENVQRKMKRFVKLWM